MKKIFFLLFALVFAGCSRDDDDAEFKRLDIVGRWEQTFFESSIIHIYVSQKDGTYFRFGSDGTFTFFYSGWGIFNTTITGTYEYEDYGVIRLTYGNETGSIIVMDPEEDGDTIFYIYGLQYDGAYKFRKI